MPIYGLLKKDIHMGFISIHSQRKIKFSKKEYLKNIVFPKLNIGVKRICE